MTLGALNLAARNHLTARRVNFNHTRRRQLQLQFLDFPRRDPQPASDQHDLSRRRNNQPHTITAPTHHTKMPRRKAPTAPAAEAPSPDPLPFVGNSRSKRKRVPSLKSREIEADDVHSSSKRRRSAASAEKEPPRDPTPEPEPEPEPESEPDAESEPENEDELAKPPPRRRRARYTKAVPVPAEDVLDTPSRRGRPRKHDPAPAESVSETPSRRGRGTANDATTPSRAADGGITPRRRNAADKSAKKKSMRALIHNIVNDEGSSDEEQTHLARAIYDSDEHHTSDEENEEPELDATPSKAPARRGRPRRKKSPTPPRDLPPHEMYFHYYKPGKVPTSDRTLSGVDLLTHDEYFSFWRERADPHATEVEFLAGLHEASFPQWEFELSQGFSVCLYGMGSKRGLLRKFAAKVHAGRGPEQDNRVVVVNGYVRTITPRDILSTVSAALDPKKPSTAQPSLLLDSITSTLAPPITLTLIVNSIDAPPLRKPGAQAILSQLASHPRIRLLCSADTPDFPLLWDISLRSTFNMVFHDATTLAPLSAELSAVDDVHELLGRATRRAGGLEAVFVVLRSLTANARRLYGLLIAEVLTAMSEGEGADGENPGVEFRMLFNKAVEAFVCPSSEMSFRQLLRE